MRKLLLAAVCTISSFAYAGIEDGKWGAAQVFDVQRNPAYPTENNDITMSNMQLPYEKTASQYTIASNQYVVIEDTDTATDTCTFRIVLKDANGATVRELHSGGQIWGLGDKGFLHISDPRDFGTFFANSEGYSYGDSVTYTAGSGLATCAQTEAYNANEIPTSIPGIPAISGTPLNQITLSSEFVFVPTVTDEDTEASALSFSVVNKPEWMNFIESTGELYGMPTELGTYTNIIISVTDGTHTVTLTPFDVEVVAENEVEGSIDASVSGGTITIINLLFGMLFVAVRRRKTLLAFFSLLLLPVTNSVAAEENEHWYLGAGGGIAKVKPDVNVTGYERDKDSSPVLILNAGYCFNEKYCLDAKHTYVNNFKVVGPANSVHLDYNVSSLGFKYTPPLGWKYFTPHVIAGASYFNVSSSSSLVDTDKDVRFNLGIGAKVYEKDNVSLLVDAMRHSKDLSTFSLNLQYKFPTGDTRVQ